MKKLKAPKIRPSDFLKHVTIAKEYARSTVIVFKEDDYEVSKP